jgi:lipoprotein-releasing system ATP-binding protein
MNEMIKVEALNKSFGELRVLNDVSLSINKGEFVSIVGQSGAGKTTLLQIIGTLDRPDSGNVWIGGESLFGMDEDSISSFRNLHIGFEFQFHQLLPEFSAIENVMIPALIGKLPKDEAEKRAKELLEFLGVEHRAEHKPNELSGGERQRVAVARALVNRPDVLLADEPSGSLDSKNKEELNKLFLRLRDELNQTLVVVTHDMEMASISDRVLRMQDGRIVN